MIKTLTLPIAMKYQPSEAYFQERLSEKRERFDALLTEQESALNSLVEDGYTILVSHLIETTNQTGLTMVLHKPDKPEKPAAPAESGESDEGSLSSLLELTQDQLQKAFLAIEEYDRVRIDELLTGDTFLTKKGEIWRVSSHDYANHSRNHAAPCEGIVVKCIPMGNSHSPRLNTSLSGCQEVIFLTSAICEIVLEYAK